MKALSVRQPWAWAIIHGGKDVENRSWRSRYRGPLLIHAAGTQEDDDVLDACRLVAKLRGLPLEQALGHYRICLKLGAVIGRVDMVDCVEDHPSPWFRGRYGFVFRNPRPVRAYRLRGRPGIFEAHPGPRPS